VKPYIFVHCDQSDYSASLRADARTGLTGFPPWLPSRWCFDGHGRHLFDFLAEAPGAHVWDAEAIALSEYAAAIAAATAARQLVYLGPLSRWRLDSLADKMFGSGRLDGVAVCDCPNGDNADLESPIPASVPRVERHHLVSDLPGAVPPLPGTRRLIVCPTVTFATVDSRDRHRLLTGLRKRCAIGDTLLVGAPLPRVPAGQRGFYADAERFNKNVLNVVNHTLDSDVSEEAFDHAVGYHERHDRLELRLRARTDVRVELRTLGFHIDLAGGQPLRTFILCGLSPERVAAELREAGFSVRKRWGASDDMVGLYLADAV
jgi:L-histidine N-alpha-methyltransferase